MAEVIAKVTEWKSAQDARFVCWNLHQLWDNDEVTVEHCVEDEEWGSSEESETTAHKADYPEGFFKPGFHLIIDHAGSMREEPL